MDCSFTDRNHFATVNKSIHQAPKQFETLNQGIIAEMTQRTKKKINL